MSLRTMEQSGVTHAYVCGEGPLATLLDDAIWCAERGHLDAATYILDEIARRYIPRVQKEEATWLANQ